MSEKIGELYYENCKKYGFVETLDGYCLSPNKDGLKTFSFDSDGKVIIKEIQSLIKHKRRNDVYRIQLKHGKKIDVTESHSVFTLKEGKIASIPVNSLKKKI